MNEIVKKLKQKTEQLYAEWMDNSYFRTSRHRTEQYKEYKRMKEMYDALVET